jgi:uncharacterized protein DUF4167
MRTSNKSRSRSKSSNRRSGGGNTGNIVNRVFDSTGPEGKVRGTPQQIIDKYQGLYHDAQRSGDRVSAENFQQHAEHYARMLGDAMREQNERREAHEARQQQSQQNQPQTQRPQHSAQPQPQSQPGMDDPIASAEGSEQPDLSQAATSDLFPARTEQSNLVETPESTPSAKRPTTRRKPAPKPKKTTEAEHKKDAPQEDAVKASEPCAGAGALGKQDNPVPDAAE